MNSDTPNPVGSADPKQQKQMFEVSFSIDSSFYRESVKGGFRRWWVSKNEITAQGLKTSTARWRELARLLGVGAHCALCRWTRCGGIGVVCVCAGADGVSNRCNSRESQPGCQREGKQVYWQMHCIYYSAWIVWKNRCGSYNAWQYLRKVASRWKW